MLNCTFQHYTARKYVKRFLYAKFKVLPSKDKKGTTHYIDNSSSGVWHIAFPIQEVLELTV